MQELMLGLHPRHTEDDNCAYNHTSTQTFEGSSSEPTFLKPKSKPLVELVTWTTGQQSSNNPEIPGWGFVVVSAINLAEHLAL